MKPSYFWVPMLSHVPIFTTSSTQSHRGSLPKSSLTLLTQRLADHL